MFQPKCVPGRSVFHLKWKRETFRNYRMDAGATIVYGNRGPILPHNLLFQFHGNSKFLSEKNKKNPKHFEAKSRRAFQFWETRCKYFGEKKLPFDWKQISNLSAIVGNRWKAKVLLNADFYWFLFCGCTLTWRQLENVFYSMMVTWFDGRWSVLIFTSWVRGERLRDEMLVLQKVMIMVIMIITTIMTNLDDIIVGE